MAGGVSGYYDFSGLSGLRAQAVRDKQDEQAIQRVGEEFETLFYQMMLDAMKKAQEPLKSDLIASDGMDQVQDMFHTEVAHFMSQRHALGIGDWLLRTVNASTPAADGEPVKGG